MCLVFRNFTLDFVYAYLYQSFGFFWLTLLPLISDSILLKPRARLKMVKGAGIFLCDFFFLVIGHNLLKMDIHCANITISEMK